MIRFKPYPGLTIATVIMVALLCGLGVWQLQRLQWKLGLIAMMDKNMHAPAIPLGDEPGMLVWEPYTEYTHVSMHGRFDNSKETYVFTTDEEVGAAYHVVTPFFTPNGQVYLVDRGMVPKEFLNPASRRAGLVEGLTHVVGIWRTPDAPGPFTPSPDIQHRIWYTKDVVGIAKADGIKLVAPVVIEADATPNPGGWPKGGQTVVDLPNNHLSYAITWFGLAAGLIGVYFAYHISKGRLAPR